MIDYISTIMEVGDQIYLTLRGREVGGKILSINSSYIVIEASDGNIIGVKEEAIESFSQMPLHRGRKNGGFVRMSKREGRKIAADPSIFSVNRRSEEEPTQHRVGAPHTKFKHYQPGDKIPLEDLAHRDPSLVSTWEQNRNERESAQKIQDGARALYEKLVVESVDLDEMVPAMGLVVELKPAFQFGFIDDMQTGERYFFNRGDIVDPLLKMESGEGIEVLYLRGTNHKGAAARCLFTPQTVGQVLEIVLQLVDEDDLLRAQQMLDVASGACPSSSSLEQMRAYIATQLAERSVDNADVDVTLYVQARKALEQKEYVQAFQLYKDCLHHGVRKANCIKEMAQVYVSLYAQEEDEMYREAIRQKGIDFINEYAPQLPDKLSSKCSLENIYFALGAYEQHIEVVKSIIEESEAKGDLPKYLFYINKEAQSYLRLGDYARAKEVASQGLKADPENVYLLKTLASIEAQSDEDLQ